MAIIRRRFVTEAVAASEPTEEQSLISDMCPNEHQTAG
jgi:hypothetical protein